MNDDREYLELTAHEIYLWTITTVAILAMCYIAWTY